jgi:hypothetical protein
MHSPTFGLKRMVHVKRTIAYRLVKRSVFGSAVSLLAGGVLMLGACSDDPKPRDLGDDGDDAEVPPPDEDGDTGKLDAGRPAKPDATTIKPPSVVDAGAAGASDAGTNPGRLDAGGVDAGKPEEAPATSCLDGITDYQSAGPFKFEAKTSGKVKLWVPAVPAGCKVPVVHLANGTTANCGNYMSSLERLASHGFLAACYEDPNTGAGTYGIMAFEAAMSMFPDLVDNKLGSTGHSQGGQASLVTLALAEAKWGDKMTYTGLAMEPASGYGTQPSGGTWQSYYAKIKSPVFMFSGDSSTGFANSSLAGISTGDGLVAISWVAQGFEALSKSIEAYHWTAIGATHIPTPEEQENQVSIPWFRWKLLGDGKACEFFKKMPDGKKWKLQKEQNAASCP